MNEIEELLRERSRIAEDLITRAWTDDAFKALLLADPAKAVEAAYGLKLPQSVTVKVLEETENTRYVVIPCRPSTCGELSDEDLAATAGGVSASDASIGGSGSTRADILRGISVTNTMPSTSTIDAQTATFNAARMTC